MFIQIYSVSSFFMLKATLILSIDISALTAMEGRKGGKLSRWRVFGLKQNPWTQLTLGLQLGRQGEKPAKDMKIQGLTLDLDVLTLDSGQSAFFCAHLQHPRLSVCRSVYQIPPFLSSNHNWDRQFPYVVSRSLYYDTSMMNYYYC